jgi:hypothetical protein
MKTSIVLLALILGIAGCRKAGTGSNKGATKIDACTLLTSAEIESVQGSPIIETKSTEHSEASLRNSQCYFATKQSSLSVSLVLAQADPDHPSPRTVKEYWKDTFGPDAKKGKEREEEEHEREGAGPTEIAGVGEEAYWVGVRVGGALYAIKGDVFVRVSVGGPDDQKAKIEKSKALAKKALDRL